MNSRRVSTSHRTSVAQKLIGLLAVPIGAGVILATWNLIKHFTSYPGDIFGWVAVLAGILAGGAWVSIVDNGLPRWLGNRLLRIFDRPEVLPFMRPLSPGWKKASKYSLWFSITVWWISYAAGSSLLGYRPVPDNPDDNSLAVTFGFVGAGIWILIVLFTPDIAFCVRQTWRRLCNHGWRWRR